MTPVAIFVPPLVPFEEYRRTCSWYCLSRQYHVVTVARSAQAVALMYGAGRIEKVVMARLEHLAELITDAEVITDRPDLDRRGHRTRRIPRPRAGR